MLPSANSSNLIGIAFPLGFSTLEYVQTDGGAAFPLGFSTLECVQTDGGPHTECLLLVLDHHFLLLGFQTHLSALLAFG